MAILPIDLPLYGLLGRKLSHSFSQGYFRQKFKEEGIAADYILLELEHIEQLPAQLAAIPQLRGFNVTIPYKQAILPFLSWLSPLAKAAGAVNTVVVTESGLHGYNTDILGLETALLEKLAQMPFYPAPEALILGNGGGSQAARVALTGMGYNCHTAARHPTDGELDWSHLHTTAWQELIARMGIIINTTPIGMYPDSEALVPLPYQAIAPQHLLFDLIYNPAITPFLAQGQARGAQTLNGLPMLHAQAEEAWKVWGGEK